MIGSNKNGIMGIGQPEDACQPTNNVNYFTSKRACGKCRGFSLAAAAHPSQSAGVYANFLKNTSCFKIFELSLQG